MVTKKFLIANFDHSVFFAKNHESFWQKGRMVTHILFDLCLFKHFSPVANFGYESILTVCRQILMKLDPSPFKLWTSLMDSPLQIFSSILQSTKLGRRAENALGKN